MQLIGMDRLNNKALKLIINPSLPEIEQYLTAIFYGKGCISLIGDNEFAAEKLIIFCEKGRCYMELLDPHDEYQVRVYNNYYIPLEQNSLISIDHASDCYLNTTTTDFSLVLKICEEFRSTNNVSNNIMV